MPDPINSIIDNALEKAFQSDLAFDPSTVIRAALLAAGYIIVPSDESLLAKGSDSFPDGLKP